MGITLRMSDQACEIMPGQAWCQCARIQSTPSTAITITIDLPGTSGRAKKQCLSQHR